MHYFIKEVNSKLDFESCSWRDALDTLCDEVYQWLVAGRWFSPTNKTDRYDVTWNIIESVVKHHNPRATDCDDGPLHFAGYLLRYNLHFNIFDVLKHI
jgi:hypothetical protein